MENLLWIFVSALLVNNFVLAYFLGLCPFCLLYTSPSPRDSYADRVCRLRL